MIRISINVDIPEDIDDKEVAELRRALLKEVDNYLIEHDVSCTTHSVVYRRTVHI